LPKPGKIGWKKGHVTLVASSGHLIGDVDKMFVYQKESKNFEFFWKKLVGMNVLLFFVSHHVTSLSDTCKTTDTTVSKQ